MERWFNKYPKQLKEKHALKMIHKQLHKAMDLCDEDKEFLPCMSKLHEMVEDFLEAKSFLTKVLPAPKQTP